MEIAANNPPVWKYQRQFDFAEGVSTIEQRPNLLRRHGLSGCCRTSR